MKTTYRKLYKFHTKALAEDWLIKKNPQDVYDFYIIDEDKFYYNVIEDKKLKDKIKKRDHSTKSFTQT